MQIKPIIQEKVIEFNKGDAEFGEYIITIFKHNNINKYKVENFRGSSWFIRHDTAVQENRQEKYQPILTYIDVNHASMNAIYNFFLE